MSDADSLLPTPAQAQRLCDLLRRSRLTMVYGAAGDADGSGATAVLRDGVAPLLRRRASDFSATRQRRTRAPVPFIDRRRPASHDAPEIVIVVDRWEHAPLAQAHRLLDDALAQQPEPQRLSLADHVAALSERHGVRFLFLLDQFEQCLAGATTRRDLQAFADELVAAVNRPSLAANFLVALDERAGAAATQFQRRIVGFDAAPVALPDADARAHVPPAAAGDAGGSSALPTVRQAQASVADADRTATPTEERAAAALSAADAEAPVVAPEPANAAPAVPLATEARAAAPALEQPPEATTQGPAAATAAATGEWPAPSRRRRSTATVAVQWLRLWLPRAAQPAAAPRDWRRTAAVVGAAGGAALIGLAVWQGPGPHAPPPETTARAPQSAPPAPPAATPVAQPKAVPAPPAAPPQVELAIETNDPDSVRLADQLATATGLRLQAHAAPGWAAALAQLQPAAPHNAGADDTPPLRLAVARYDALQAARAGAGGASAAQGVQIVAPLFTEPLAVLVRADAPQRFLHEIDGLRIDAGAAGSSRRLTAETLHQRLFGTPLAAQPAGADAPASALDALRRGETDAVLLLGTPPAASLAGLKQLPLDPDAPASRRAMRSYLPVPLGGRAAAPAATPALTLAVMSFLVTAAPAPGALPLGDFAAAMCRALPALRQTDAARWRDVRPQVRPPIGWPYADAASTAFDRCETAGAAGAALAAR